MKLSISSREIAFWLLVAVLILNLASFVARVIENLLGHVGTSELLRLTNVSEEGSIATWFSVLLLLFSAVFFAFIAWDRSCRTYRHTHERIRFHRGFLDMCSMLPK